MEQIVLFTPTLNDGGMENKTALLANALNGRGWSVKVLVLNNTAQVYQIDDRIEIVDLQVKNKAEALKALVRWAKKNKPALLYSISTPFNALWIMTKLLSGYPKKLIIGERNHLSSAVKYSNKLSDKLRPLITRLLYPFADSVICVSESVRQDLLSVSGLEPSKVVTLWNMIDTKDTTTSNEADLNENNKDAPLFLAVGRLNRQKDHLTLIKAFAKVRESKPSKLVILGEGPLRADLSALVEELGLEEDLKMPGFTVDPTPWYRSADVVVLPSLYEGLPGVLLEALAMGKSIVSTDCPGGSAEILQDGKFGELVPVGDVNSLAEAMLNALDHPHDPFTQRQRAENFSIETLLPKYIEHLKNL